MSLHFERFRTQAQNSQQNILSYIFFYITLCYGITFGFFSSTATVEATALAGAAIPPLFWGVMSILVILAILTSISLRWKRFGQFVSSVAFGLWLYVLVVAIFIGAWFGAVVIALPMVVFWTFWFLGVYQNNGDKPL